MPSIIAIPQVNPSKNCNLHFICFVNFISEEIHNRPAMDSCCDGKCCDDVALEEDEAADLAWRIYAESGGPLERREFEKQDLADEWIKVLRSVPAHKYGYYLEEGKATDFRQYLRYIAVMNDTHSHPVIGAKVESMRTFMEMSFFQRGCYILYLSCSADAEPMSIAEFTTQFPTREALLQFFVMAHLLRDTFDDDLPFCSNFVSTTEMLALASETPLKKQKPDLPQTSPSPRATPRSPTGDDAVVRMTHANPQP